VAGILGSLDEKIENNRRLIRTAEALARTLFKKHIVSNEESAGWENGKVSDIANITMGQSPIGSTYNNDGIGLPLINGAADFKDRKIAPTKWTSDPKKITKKGDYIFGVRATIGQITTVDGEYAIGRGAGIARAKDKTNDEFLYFCLEQLFCDFETRGSGSVYINISKSDFENYKIKLPPAAVLQTFNAAVEPLFAEIDFLTRENQTLAATRDKLLRKLIK
jgi:type I restriction enzyme S subunit